MDPLHMALLSAALLATGAVAGLLAGLLGVGGGIVIVPTLYYLFTLLGIDETVRMHVAVGTSLATLIPTSIVSMRAHAKRGVVDRDLLKSLGPWIFGGVVIGTAFAGWVKGPTLTGVFAVIALLVAANMALRPEGITLAKDLPPAPYRHAVAVAVGAFSVMMGIGGGTLTVPILSACSYPIRRAVGTASAIGLLIGLPGALGFAWNGIDMPGRPPATLGYVNWIGFLLIVPTTMVLVPVGARIAHAINPAGLRKLFALFLFITSLRMIAALVK
ncbi:MAG: sulfite exporter TauE/SafE family protein [Alphaproteobacteria bacterium]|nr:sulfite exporter TauE/SafE family protein [Alphaproteobacteria bacterium]